MEMTDDDIVKEYREAKHKSRQIGILADLNGCAKNDIKCILIRHGALNPSVIRAELDEFGLARKFEPDTEPILEPSDETNKDVPAEVFNLVATELDRLDEQIAKKEEEIRILTAEKEDMDALYAKFANFMLGKR